MAAGVYLPTARKLRGDTAKAKEKVVLVRSASYLNDFMISLEFSTGEVRVIDFLPLFHKYVRGTNLKYFSIDKFKKFHVQNGNLFWGKDEGIIFSLDLLYGFGDQRNNEVLYVVK